MKNVVTMLLNISCGILLLLILLTLAGRMNHSMEIKSNLSSITEETVEKMGNGVYSSKQVAEAQIAGELIERMESMADIMLEIEKTSVEKGLLAVKVTESWKHPNGKTGTVQDSRIAIFNQLDVPKIKEITVKFYMSKEDMEKEESCYKCLYLYEGDKIAVPMAPVKNGLVFDGWRDSSDYIADFSVPVQQDIVYYAAWR